MDIDLLLDRLAKAHHAVRASREQLAKVEWLDRAPRDYAAFLQRFGGSAVVVFNWTLPAADRLGDLDAAFRAGGGPERLLPFASQDDTWFMAFDLEAEFSSVVSWDHEQAAAEPWSGTFTTWLSAQLDAEADVEREEAVAKQEQQAWALAHVPFNTTPLGQAVVKALDSRVGPALRDVLLDLHLQYTFQPRVVDNAGLSYAGLLHFTAEAIGCWRCGRMNASGRRCESCGEDLLCGTYELVRAAPRHRSAWQETFGRWAAAHVDVRSPRPALVTTAAYPKGIPKWARLRAFGGSRDPRLSSAEQEPDLSGGDTF